MDLCCCFCTGPRDGEFAFYRIWSFQTLYQLILGCYNRKKLCRVEVLAWCMPCEDSATPSISIILDWRLKASVMFLSLLTESNLCCWEIFVIRDWSILTELKRTFYIWDCHVKLEYIAEVWLYRTWITIWGSPSKCIPCEDSGSWPTPPTKEWWNEFTPDICTAPMV